MNYSKIKVLQVQNEFSDRKMAHRLKMSDVGYRKMMENHTCTVETLERIAALFRIDICSFFREDYQGAQEPPENYDNGCKLCEEKDSRIKTLEERLKDKDEIISLYRRKQ